MTHEPAWVCAPGGWGPLSYTCPLLVDLLGSDQTTNCVCSSAWKHLWVLSPVDGLVPLNVSMNAAILWLN